MTMPLRAQGAGALRLVAALLLGTAQLVAQQPAPADFFARLAASHVDTARARTLQACADRGIALPADFVAWIDADPILRTSVYGCRKEPLPVLLMLRSLEIDLGEAVVRREFPQLALALAMQASYRAPSAKASGWNDGDGEGRDAPLPDVGPRAPLQLRIAGDPRVPADTKDPSRTLDLHDHVINFLEDHAPIEIELPHKELPPLEYDDKGKAKPRGKAVTVMKKSTRPLCGADVIASAALQQEFHSYMAAHGFPETRLDCGDRTVHWLSTEAVQDKALRERIKAAHDLFHDAYREKGRMPAERDRAPTPAESMAWFVRNATDTIGQKWPLFPLNAPWPVLMMLAADDQPLREREDIWVRYRDRGEMRTYGEYIGGIAQQFDMQSARRVSPFAFSYGSIQMMWKDGGVCGTMGNIGARTYRICGVPSSTAGQPGHCAIVLMEHDPATGAYRCKGGQYATGGDEVTTVHAGWNYDDKGGRRPMVFHQSVAWGVSRDFARYVDSLAMLRAFAAMDEAERGGRCVEFARAALACSPFALAAVEAAAAAAPTHEAAMEVLDAFTQATAPQAEDRAFDLYRSTVKDLVHAAVERLPQPKGKSESAQLLRRLEQQRCERPTLLARCWREVGGEDEFRQRTLGAALAYAGSKERHADRRVQRSFAADLQAWGKSVKGAAQKRAWAGELLSAFEGREFLVKKGKRSEDAAVTALSKLAGREPPKP